MNGENKSKIKNLDSWDFSDTRRVQYGVDLIPEATPDNMVTLMNKINELIKTVNKLVELNSIDN